MAPILTTVQVMGDVEVLVPVLQGLMLVMTLRPRHRAHPLPDRCCPKNRPYTALRQPDKTPRQAASILAASNLLLKVNPL
jgi:hypothetical protein